MKTLIRGALAIGLTLGALVGTAGPANAHVSYCYASRVAAPHTNFYGDKLGWAELYCPPGGHQTAMYNYGKIKKDIFGPDKTSVTSPVWRGRISGYTFPPDLYMDCRLGPGAYYTEWYWYLDGPTGPSDTHSKESSRTYPCGR